MSRSRSQCRSLSLRPPSDGKPAPSARWIVPAIFSSKRTLRVGRGMASLQPNPGCPSRGAPAAEPRRARVRVERLEQPRLPCLGGGLDDLARAKAEADARDLAVGADQQLL